MLRVTSVLNARLVILDFPIVMVTLSKKRHFSSNTYSLFDLFAEKPRFRSFACDCSLIGSSDCDINGKCICRQGYSGSKCNECTSGYSKNASGSCAACNCDQRGTNGIACSKSFQCSCKKNFKGLRCNACNDGYYSFPTCRECQCDQYGSVNQKCNSDGKCTCKTGYTGTKCNQCTDAYFKTKSGKCGKNVSSALTFY